MSLNNLSQVKAPTNQKFGLLFTFLFLSFFVYFQWKRSSDLATISASLALFFVLVTIVAPSVLTPLNRAWFALGLSLGKVVSPIVFSAIFFILITPVALITRLFGRDALLLKKRQVSTYWADKVSIEPESFKNQF